jgi:hypothetical protein
VTRIQDLVFATRHHRRVACVEVLVGQGREGAVQHVELGWHREMALKCIRNSTRGLRLCISVESGCFPSLHPSAAGMGHEIYCMSDSSPGRLERRKGQLRAFRVASGLLQILTGPLLHTLPDPRRWPKEANQAARRLCCRQQCRWRRQRLKRARRVDLLYKM